VLEALADPTRRSVWERLTGGPMTVVEHCSRVTIAFAPDGERTEVTLVHDEFERHGSTGADGVRDGWAIPLEAFAAAIDSAPDARLPLLKCLSDQLRWRPPNRVAVPPEYLSLRGVPAFACRCLPPTIEVPGR
jgi:hypothetical protein